MTPEEGNSSPDRHESPSQGRVVFRRPLVRTTPPHTPQLRNPQTPASRRASEPRRQSTRTSHRSQRFMGLTKAQMMDLRKQSRRLPPPGSVHQNWGPNDVRQRVIENRTLNQVNNQQARAQTTISDQNQSSQDDHVTDNRSATSSHDIEKENLETIRKVEKDVNYEA